MKKEKEFTDVAHDIQKAWESFDKNSQDPAAYFEPIGIDIIKNHGLFFKDDNEFVSDMLDRYRENIVDNFTECGQSVKEWFFDEICVLGRNSTEHYIQICWEALV